jgi:butyrate kinase
MYILVINPGSTSTKLAIYKDIKELHKKTLAHSREELSEFGELLDQLDFRHGLVMDFLTETGFPSNKLDCVISRGGSPPDARSGATAVNDALVTALREQLFL